MAKNGDVNSGIQQCHPPLDGGGRRAAKPPNVTRVTYSPRFAAIQLDFGGIWGLPSVGLSLAPHRVFIKGIGREKRRENGK